MADKKDWQLLLSIGSHLLSQDFHSVSSNVLLVDCVPQIEVLKRTSIMINHGGLNTIKECIFFDVPMIVFPLVGDQLKNADCVVHHQLGLRGDINEVSVNLIRSMIDEIDGNQVFRFKIEMMKDVFRRAENDERAASIIESTLSARKRPYNGSR